MVSYYFKVETGKITYLALRAIDEKGNEVTPQASGFCTFNWRKTIKFPSWNCRKSIRKAMRVTVAAKYS